MQSDALSVLPLRLRCEDKSVISSLMSKEFMLFTTSVLHTTGSSLGVDLILLCASVRMFLFHELLKLFWSSFLYSTRYPLLKHEVRV